MQAVEPKTFAKPPAADAERSAARLSLRAVAVLEIASVLGSVLITAWAIAPLQLRERWLEAAPGLLALALMVNSHRWHGETPQMLGFTTRYFWRAARLLIAPMVVCAALLVGGGYAGGTLNFNERFWLSLAVLPFWGLTQQYILQAFIYRRLKLALLDPRATESGSTLRTRLAIVLAASLFALVHLPNWPLMALTLAGGLVWTWVYERAPNLFALGLSHGLMSAVTMSSLPAWLLHSMSVGYKHFIYQKF
jgi:membrane protease YdiL (CAAX protease family)